MTLTKIADIRDQWGDVLEVDHGSDTLYLEIRDETPEIEAQENIVGLSVDGARELRNAIDAFLNKRTPAEPSSS